MRNNHELTTLRNRALWNDFYRTRNEWFDKHLIFTKRQLLTHVLNNCRPHYYVTFDYAAFKEQQYDKLADWVRQQVDMEYIYQTLRGEK